MLEDESSSSSASESITALRFFDGTGVLAGNFGDGFDGLDLAAACRVTRVVRAENTYEDFGVRARMNSTHGSFRLTGLDLSTSLRRSVWTTCFGFVAGIAAEITFGVPELLRGATSGA